MRLNYYDRIFIEITSNCFQSKLLYQLLTEQVDSFKMNIFPSEFRHINLIIEFTHTTSIELYDGIIKYKICALQDVNLPLILQFYAIINDSLIVHGAVLKFEKNATIVTGKGGVGKTHICFKHFSETSQKFSGDDISLLSGKLVFPIIRPLCIYPEHLNLQVFNQKLSDLTKIYTINWFALKVIRKLSLYFLLFFPNFKMISTQLMKRTTSKYSFAYVNPESFGMQTCDVSLEIDGIVALLKENKDVPTISHNYADIVEGTMYEFGSYENVLSKLLSASGYKLEFLDYVKDKLCFILPNLKNHSLDKIKEYIKN